MGHPRSKVIDVIRFDHLSNTAYVKGQGEFGKVTYGFLFVPNSNHRRRTSLRVINDFQLEPFLGGPILTLRGHRRSKVKVDFEVLGMGSY